MHIPPPGVGQGIRDRSEAAGDPLAPLDGVFCVPEDGGALCGGGVVVGGVDCHPPQPVLDLARRTPPARDGL
ncbi:hypothetical protein [Streptomyces chartreusis]|uniref:hypothetical protein n=1 Tax=Streptomyces chartreusis TaxID=1969 RepID=UPI0037B3BA43